MANNLTATLTLAYGDTATQGNVLSRQNFAFSLAYAEESSKIVHVPASSTDFPVNLDTVGSPKFLFARTLDIDVTLKLSDTVDDVPSALAAASGWLMICNPSGQAVKQLLATTPPSPASGAHIQVIAFE